MGGDQSVEEAVEEEGEVEEFLSSVQIVGLSSRLKLVIVFNQKAIALYLRHKPCTSGHIGYIYRERDRVS